MRLSYSTYFTFLLYNMQLVQLEYKGKSAEGPYKKSIPITVQFLRDYTGRVES